MSCRLHEEAVSSPLLLVLMHCSLTSIYFCYLLLDMNVPRFNLKLLFFSTVSFQSSLKFCPWFFKLIKQCNISLLVNIYVARMENMFLVNLHLLFLKCIYKFNRIVCFTVWIKGVETHYHDLTELLSGSRQIFFVFLFSLFQLMSLSLNSYKFPSNPHHYNFN